MVREWRSRHLKFIGFWCSVFPCINAIMDKRGFVIDLGLMDYGRAWEIQHLLWKRRVEGSLPDLLLLLNH